MTDEAIINTFMTRPSPDILYTRDQMREAIRLARASEREWVSCEDRLPELEVPVLVKGGVAMRIHDGWATLMGPDYGRVIQWTVTHWMPLPQPPTT